MAEEDAEMKLFVWDHTNVLNFGNFYGTSMLVIMAESEQDAITEIRRRIVENPTDNNIARLFDIIQGCYPLMYEKQYCWENPECTEWHETCLKAHKECCDNSRIINPTLWKSYWEPYSEWCTKTWWEISAVPTKHFAKPKVYECNSAQVFYSTACD